MKTGLFLVAFLLTASGLRAGDTNLAGQILTEPVAAAALGTAVKADELQPDTRMGGTTVSRITYTTIATPQRQVGLLIRRGDTADQTKNIFDSSKAAFHGVDVPGIGDAAYRTKMPAQLDILHGADWIIITAGTFRSPEPAVQEKAAAAVLKALTK